VSVNTDDDSATRPAMIAPRVGRRSAFSAWRALRLLNTSPACRANSAANVCASRSSTPFELDAVDHAFLDRDGQDTGGRVEVRLRAREGEPFVPVLMFDRVDDFIGGRGERFIHACGQLVEDRLRRQLLRTGDPDVVNGRRGLRRRHRVLREQRRGRERAEQSQRRGKAGHSAGCDEQPQAKVPCTQRLSTTIAMPIPPPMHRDATP
jgi:hypothetical protein